LRIVIMRHAFFGDVLITFPILRELRAKYKNDHIVFVGHPAALPLAQAWGLADEVQKPDENLYIELYADEGFHSPALLNLFHQADLVISLMRNRTDEMIKNLHAVGVKEVIAATEFRSSLSSKHVMEVLAESIGMDNLDARHIASFTANSDDFCLFDGPVVIHPGRSRKDPRCWPAASYAAVIQQLVRRQQPVTLLAGPGDMEQLAEIRKRLPSSLPTGLLTIMENAPILQVAQAIAKSRCYLGSDSGITHLAALTGARTIALLGPTNAAFMGPLGPAVELIQKDPLRRLSVDHVLTSVLKYL
jgi:heptosyltransferase III